MTSTSTVTSTSTMNSTATVGVNLTWLVPGVVGGSEEYTVRLLEAAGPRLPPGLALRLYARPDLVRAHPGLAAGVGGGGRTRVEVIEVPRLPGGRLARVAQESTWLAAASRHDDVVHHAGGTIPMVRSAAGIVTIHDLQPIEHPENFGAVKRRWLGWSLPRAARSARLVLCPSHKVGQRLQDVLGLPSERIRVVPHGHRLPEAGQSDLGQPEMGQPDLARAGRSAHRGRFLLYPAIAYTHKRHIDLVRLLDRLGPDNADVSLVLTGRPGPESEAVADEARRLGVADRVEAVGRVPWAELAALYRSAAALVFPSAYEGFGNPAVEAMGLGCPAVVSDAGALPEVVGSAGLVFPVGDVGAMAAAVTRVLDDPELAADLRRRGRARAAEFDVDMAADRLVDVYREVVDIARR